MNLYTEIFKYFLKLGFVAFGGPAAHISIMEEDLVEKKKWMDRQEFLDYIGITNLIPGPNSTEVTMHCGYHRGGILGLFIAGFAFITPAVLLTGLIAYLLGIYGELTAIAAITQGFKLMVLIIIAQACYRLFKKAAKDNYLIGLSLIAAVVYWFYPNEIILLLAVILISIMKYYGMQKMMGISVPLFFFFQTPITAEVSSELIFFNFLKIGSILFGSGYVLFAYVDSLFVQQLGILSTKELLDAIAIGQFTPGPVLSTSTYIGYILDGNSGALWATLGIFLPSFIFVLLTSPFVHKIRKSKLLSEALDGVNVVSLAFMVVVTLKMAFKVVTDVQAAIILAIAAFLFFKVKSNPILLLIFGGLVYLIMDLMTI